MDYTGQKIEKYVVKRLIGEGGMASVYEAEHEVLGTKAAIKILNPVLTANADIRERFMNEAKMMASFQHTNITKIIDFEETDTFLAIIMEFLEGQDLSERIESGAKLTESEITSIFEQTLSAFQYAHEKGVIHRDIKPSNIYILPNGKVKILDFGIAKLFGQGNEKTQAGTQMGTPIYMSPEQVKADKSIDHRSDIYSLGVTLYFALNGKPPYDSDGASQFDIFNKIVYEPLPELTGDSKLIAMVKKACQKDRDQRYQSCEEWLEDLRAIQTGSSTVEQKPPLKPEEPVQEKTKIEESIPISGKVEMKDPSTQNPTSNIPKSSGAAIVALVFGLIALITSWIPFVGLIIGLIALILGLIGRKDKFNNPSSNKGFAIAGISLGGLSIFIGVIMIFFTMIVVDEINAEERAIQKKKQLELAINYFDSTKYELAFKIFSDTAYNNNSEAQYYLGRMYAAGLYVQTDINKAFEYAKKSSDQGNAKGLNLLGKLYEDKKEIVKAIDCYKKASDLGNAKGFFNLAEIYYFINEGIDQDWLKAIELANKAIDAYKNDVQIEKEMEGGPEHLIATIYANGGFGVEINYQKAIDYYLLAIEKNNSGAANDLGVMYDTGKGVEQDDNLSFKYYNISANMNNAFGQSNLGFLYLNGNGVPIDESKAFELFKKSAEQNNSFGLANLGYMYQFDKGGAGLDIDKARMYYKQAAELGNEWAKDQLELIR